MVTCALRMDDATSVDWAWVGNDCSYSQAESRSTATGTTLSWPFEGRIRTAMGQAAWKDPAVDVLQVPGLTGTG